MSSKFEQALKAAMNNELSITENGAYGFKTTSSKLLDINFAASSLRNKDEDEVAKMFSEAYYENPLLAVKWMFMLRDVRGGMGERNSFRICLKWLASIRPDVVQRLIKLISAYGRWDDLFCLISMKQDDKIDNEVLGVIDEQWAEDVKNMKEGKSISLLAKWMPSCNTSSSATVKLAKYFCKELSLTEKQYRQTLSAMRKHIDVVECKMSAKKWKEIDYEAVPSMANVKYNAAFFRNDSNRRQEYLDKLSEGKAKINSAACFPSDIVHAYTNSINTYKSAKISEDKALEAMWKALPDMNIDGNVICCCDGSGSMMTEVDYKSSMSALDVCNALGIYCSEHLTGPFKDKYITFSNRPQFVDMSKAKSLAEKLTIAYQHNECANTNIEAVMDLILETAVKNSLKQEEIPDLVILSDMEFDDAIDYGKTSLQSFVSLSRYAAAQNAIFERIRQKWEKAGYELVRIVFWNIASRFGTVPMQQNKNGVVLCSGYSQSQFKMLASNKIDPYEVLIETLSDSRYDAVENAVKEML